MWLSVSACPSFNVLAGCICPACLPLSLAGWWQRTCGRPGQLSGASGWNLNFYHSLVAGEPLREAHIKGGLLLFLPLSLKGGSLYSFTGGGSSSGSGLRSGQCGVQQCKWWHIHIETCRVQNAACQSILEKQVKIRNADTPQFTLPFVVNPSVTLQTNKKDFNVGKINMGKVLYSFWTILRWKIILNDQKNSRNNVIIFCLAAFSTHCF